MKFGEVFIDNLDIISYRSMPTTYDWGLMCELIKKEAPIIGLFNPEPDFENYNWVMIPSIYGTLIKWSSRK